jgi:hypothetical protein
LDNDLSEGTDDEVEDPILLKHMKDDLARARIKLKSVSDDYAKNKALYDEKTAQREELDNEIASILNYLEAPDSLKTYIDSLEKSIERFVDLDF